MDKYSIIKKYIDELDYLNLLANHAPGDEFDEESKEIAVKVTESLTVQGIAWIIAEVLNKHLMITTHRICLWTVLKKFIMSYIIKLQFIK